VLITMSDKEDSKSQETTVMKKEEDQDEEQYESDYEYEDSDLEVEVQHTKPAAAPKLTNHLSEEAKAMSVKAEKATQSGQKRLAQDLYRVMASDTTAAGFFLHPSDKDCMKK